MKIRKAKRIDTRDIWKIRNHTQIRQQSKDEKRIQYKTHYVWYETFLKNRNNVFFVIEDKKSIIGYCRYRFEKNHYIVSIAIHPLHQKKGYGFLLLSESLRKMKKIRKNITAAVKITNNASLVLFTRAGFSLESSDDQFYYLMFHLFNS